MADTDDISRSAVLRQLQALLIVYDVELASLRFEIDSHWVDSKGVSAAIARRDAVLLEWGKTMSKIEDLQDPDASINPETFLS